MNKEKFEKIIADVTTNMRTYPTLRHGQAIYNEFYKHFPKEVDKIKNTNEDCFDNDSKVNNFIYKIFELTKAEEDCFKSIYKIYEKLS